MISLLCPTRERADRCKLMIESALQTSHDARNVEILLYVDQDDPELQKYRQEFSDCLWTGPTQPVGHCWNILANRCKGDYLRLTNDDEIFHTTGWDTKLSEAHKKAFPDEIGIVFCKDGIQNGSLCAFPMMSRRVYEIWGCFCPQVFEFFFHDTCISDIMKRINRIHYVPDVFIEHRHWTLKKDPKDETTRRQREGEGQGRAKRDKALFDSTVHIRQTYADKLKLHMNKVPF